jgi:tetratricopeptide (TPR) repeat protein
VATFHLMGYTVWQYHAKLGFEPDTGALLPQRVTDPDDAVLAQAEALAADGELAAAEAVLREHIRERGGSDAVRARHRKLLQLRGDKAALLADGRDGINILLARDDERRALDLWRECRTLDPAFWPSDPEHVFRLASRAATLGQTDLALKSVTGFHKAFPKHRDIPRNYLLAARLMVDRFGEDGKALALLRQLQAGFPQHPLAGEIADYARVVEALVAKRPKA